MKGRCRWTRRCSLPRWWPDHGRQRGILRPYIRRRRARLLGRCWLASLAIQRGLLSVRLVVPEHCLDKWGMLRTGIKVHRNVGHVQLLQGIVGTFQIGVVGVGALLHIHVGNQVCQAVGFWGGINKLLGSIGDIGLKFEMICVYSPITKMI